MADRSARRLWGDTHQQRTSHLRNNVCLDSGARLWSGMGAPCGERVRARSPRPAIYAPAPPTTSSTPNTHTHTPKHQTQTVSKQTVSKQLRTACLSNRNCKAIQPINKIAGPKVHVPCLPGISSKPALSLSFNLQPCCSSQLFFLPRAHAEQASSTQSEVLMPLSTTDMNRTTFLIENTLKNTISSIKKITFYVIMLRSFTPLFLES